MPHQYFSGKVQELIERANRGTGEDVDSTNNIHVVSPDGTADTRLTACIPAADAATVGPANGTVFNPAPGGSTSNTAVFGTVEQGHIYMRGIKV